MVLQRVGWRTRTEMVWLKLGTDGGPL
jgi:hypothetical protein